MSEIEHCHIRCVSPKQATEVKIVWGMVQIEETVGYGL